MADRPAYWERQPDGSLKGYDADGNVIVTTAAGGSTDPHASGAPVYGVHRDPVTGESYRSREVGDGWGPRGDERADRQTGRKQEEAQRESRSNYFGANANEAIGGIDDPWLDLQSEIPTAEDYAGEHLTSELGGAQADAQAIAAQRAALAQLQQISQGGMTAQERAAMQQAQMDTRQNEKAQRDAIMQQAALRGMQGAGTTLGAQLQAQQSGANRYSQEQMTQQAMAQQRALQAMQMRGQMGGQMRGQSFQEDATRSTASRSGTAATTRRARTSASAPRPPPPRGSASPATLRPSRTAR